MTVTPKKLFTPALLTASAATYYTAPASTKTVIKKATLTNIGTDAETVDLWLVENGGSAGDSNKLLDSIPIAPGKTYEIYEMEGHIMNAADFIRALASTASKVNLQVSGVEIV